MTGAGPELVSPTGAPTAPRPRLAWLDALRGVAVLLVVVQHSGELASKGFARVTHGDAQLGQGGVMLFFLVSGFVIPLALDRGPSLRRFVVTRVTRLYPAYWVSILGVWFLWRIKQLEVPVPFRHHLTPWLANVTMVQTLLHQPQLQGQYWSLVFELLFYGGCGVLLALGLHRQSVRVAWAALALCLVVHVLARAAGHHAPLGLANLATMFVGSVAYRTHSGQLRPEVGRRVFVGALVVTQLTLLAALAGHVDASTGAPISLPAMMVAWAGAYAVFGFAFLRRDSWVPPPWLVLVGEVSYSVYLLHPLAMALVDSHLTAVLRVAVQLVASVALGWVGWRFVERPATGLGRRLART